MHQFQPYPIDLLELNPFTKLADEWMMVVAGSHEKTNALTASWGGFGVLWGKRVAYIFIRESRYTKEFLDREQYFSCCFFEAKYKAALQYFGTASGRKENKFQIAHLHVNFRDQVPYIDEGNLLIPCRKLAAVPLTEECFLDAEILPKWYSGKEQGNFHTMYVGEILDILAR